MALLLAYCNRIKNDKIKFYDYKSVHILVNMSQGEDFLSDEEKERRRILTRLSKFDLPVSKLLDIPNINKQNTYDIEIDYDRTDDNIAYAIVRNSTTVLMKTLENMMYREVPTLAFDMVKKYENTGPMLYDVLFRRIENIPITAESKEFDFFSDDQLILIVDRPDIVSIPFSDKDITTYFDDNIARFTLEAEGPTGVNIQEIDYYVKGDKLIFKPTPSQQERGITASVDPNVIITKLYKGQSINLELYAILGKGRDATKHVPVETVIYNYDKRTVKFKMITGIQSTYLDQKGDDQTILDFDYATSDFSADYLLRVESRGQMSATTIIELAVDAANEYVKVPLRDRKEDVFHLHYY
jgi:DNA-directed RNA polymerase alpha subunit